ncbi:ankyrin, partial [Acephala macrosclerotiorum]
LPFAKKWFSVAQFYNAAKNGDEETIRQLLAQGIEPDLKNPRGDSPLGRAARHGSLAVVRLLLDTQAVDIDARNIAGQSPIFWAAVYGHESIV